MSATRAKGRAAGRGGGEGRMRVGMGSWGMGRERRGTEGQVGQDQKHVSTTQCLVESPALNHIHSPFHPFMHSFEQS